MAKQTISLGTGPNTGTGEPIRTAFGKVNENFTEVYDIAQGAYDYANTIVSDTQIDPLARSTANAAYDAANSASVLGQLALDGANALSGSVSSLQSVTISLNTDVIEAQNTANIAWSTANSAFDAANNAGGNPFDQDLNTSNNVTFDTVTAANVQVDSITIGIGGNVNGQGSTLGNFSTVEATDITASSNVNADSITANSITYTDNFVVPSNFEVAAENSALIEFTDGSNSSTFFAQYDELYLSVLADSLGTDLRLNNLGVTISDGIGGSSNLTVIGNITSNTLTTTQLVVNGSSKLAKVVEPFSSIADATGVVTHDCSNNHIFYHTSLDANFTANFTNLSLANGEATSLTLVLDQGGTAYIANNVQIGGNAQTINWFANTEPTGNVNAVDVQSFSVLNNSGTYIVLGQLSTFG